VELLKDKNRNRNTRTERWKCYNNNRIMDEPPNAAQLSIRN